MKSILWALALVAAILLLAAPASAESYVYDDSSSLYYTVSGSILAGSADVKWINAYQVEAIDGPFTIVVIGPTANYQTTVVSDSFDVVISDYSTGNYLGSGNYGFNTRFNANGTIRDYIYWLELNSFDAGSLTGNRKLVLAGTGTWLKSVNRYYANIISSSIPFTFAYEPTNLANNQFGDYITYLNVYWENDLDCTYKDSYYLGNRSYVNLTRVFGDAHYPSYVKIWDGNNLTYYENTSSVDVAVVAESTPVYTAVYSEMSEQWYNQTWFDTEPTPTPGDSGGFSLSLSDTAAAVGDPITATLTPDVDAPRYSEISWTVTDPSGNSDIELYTKSSPTYTDWTHYNKTSRYFDASTSDAAHSLNFTPTSAGTWTVSAVVRDQQPPSTGAALASVSATCEVSRKAGDVDVIISIFDGARTSSSYLAGVGLTVTDLTRNGTVLYDSTGTYILGSSGTCNGLATVSAPLGDEIQIAVEKSGYISQNFTRYVQPTALPLNQMPISITLMPETTPAPDQVYMGFLVQTVAGAPISSAAVVAGGRVGTTNSAGYCQVAIAYNATVQYSVSASGYTPISGYILPTTSNSATTITLYVLTTATTTPGSDGSVTPASRDPDDIIEGGVDIVLNFYELLIYLGCFATVMGLISLISVRRRR